MKNGKTFIKKNDYINLKVKDDTYIELRKEVDCSP